VTTTPNTHVAYFIGEFPCNIDGSPIQALGQKADPVNLGSGLIANHTFSCKPSTGYSDFFQKMTTYHAVISAPAAALDPSVILRPGATQATTEEESPFKYLETSSQRAGINGLTEKVAPERLGIIGLGGTGSYVLDFAAKSPAREIHLFDGDVFLNHNAFRAPGAASVEELKAPNKAEHFAKVYSNIRWKLHAHPVYVTADNLSLVTSLSFVFVCIDAGPAKRVIIDGLVAAGVPFVDVGMGVNHVNGALCGAVGATLSVPGHNDEAMKHISFDDTDAHNDYSKNIQIAELNALNAVMAVVKWKKFRGIYHDRAREVHSRLVIEQCALVTEGSL
jgi:hypothetical protein